MMICATGGSSAAAVLARRVAKANEPSIRAKARERVAVGGRMNRALARLVPFALAAKGPRLCRALPAVDALRA
jgi:hypothetical protein